MKLRLGAPGIGLESGVGAWIEWHQREGYRSAYCPLYPGSSDSEIAEVRAATEAADLVIAEVGAWSNSISIDESTRKAAIKSCKNALQLADKIGARCAVNIAGSRGEQWDGPYAENLSEDTFALIVDVVREIIDDVDPEQACYALETMPWVFPHTVDAYLRLINAIDREHFGVHFDPVNLVSSPLIYFNTGALIREAFAKLGDRIVGCHLKDITLRSHLTVHLDEILPGLGNLDYRTLLTEAARCGDIPMVLEHLSTPEEFKEAAKYVRSIAVEVGVEL